MKASRAILVGWALGIFESGMVLSSLLHFSSGPWFVVMAVVSPMVIYGLGGWVLSKFPGADRYPWDILFFLGALVLVHLRRHLYIGTHGLLNSLGMAGEEQHAGFGMVFLAAFLALVLWQMVRDPERRSRLGSVVGTVAGLYILVRLRHFSSNRPQDPRQWGDLAGVPFDLGTDWIWIAAAVVLVAWIWFVPPRLLRPSAWVPRLAAASILVPFVTLGYLWANLEKEPMRMAEAEFPGGAGPNVVLVSWDTVRADSLPPYGGGGLDTPALDRLAAEGVLIERYHTIAPITGPAHNSMLTGLYPPSHGLRVNGNAVHPEVPRMPELFRQNGYATGGFVSGLPVRRQYGFFRGFETFDDRPEISAKLPIFHSAGFLVRTVVLVDRLQPLLSLVMPPNIDFVSTTTPGHVTASRAAAWATEQDRPFFAWVHFFDAHDPRDTTGVYEEFVERARARAAEGPKAAHPEAQESWILQRAEIEFMDAQLGKLLEALEVKDPGLRNTVVAIVADHGECFGEGQDFPELYPERGLQVQHSPSLFEATQHVVCIIKPQAGVPGMLPGGSRIDDDTASHVDLLPTLLQLAGLDAAAPELLQGRSLLPALRGEKRGEWGLYLEAHGDTLQKSRLQGWITDGWKFVRTEGGEFEFLFDLRVGDSKDFSADHPDRLREMRAALDAAFEKMPVLQSIEGSANDAAGMEGLGYVDN